MNLRIQSSINYLRVYMKVRIQKASLANPNIPSELRKKYLESIPRYKCDGENFAS